MVGIAFEQQISSVFLPTKPPITDTRVAKARFSSGKGSGVAGEALDMASAMFSRPGLLEMVMSTSKSASKSSQRVSLPDSCFFESSYVTA